MPRGTTLRNIRIGEDLWTAALAKATLEGTDVSTVVRALLAKWLMVPPLKRD